MTRINKSIASKVAGSVSNKKYGQKIKDLRESLKEKATKEYRSHVPCEIIKIADAGLESSKYLKYTSEVRVRGNGWNGEMLSIESSPTHSGSYGYTTLDPTKEKAASMRKIYDKINDLVKSRDSLKSQLENAFLSLGTYHKIRETFPELAEHFPEEQKLAIMLQFDDLKTKLKEKVS